MRYGEKEFLAPGDTLKSTQENMNFHRDMTYKVSKCFQLDGNLLVYIENKYGKDVLYYNSNNFEYTAKTITNVEKRIKETTLLNFWRNPTSTYEVFNGWDRTDENNVIKESTLYKLENKCHFISNPKAIASITKKTHKGESQVTYIYHLDEFFNYFYNEIPDSKWDYDFHIENLTMSTQSSFDHLLFISTQNYEIYNELLINKSEYDDHIYITSNLAYESFDKFKKFIGQLIFDTQEISKDQIQIIVDIMVLFKELPSSHSSTSVSKILNGTSKVKINKLEQYVGKYKGVLKQPQLFELASYIENFLFKFGIFTTKEDYSSDKDGEWRGNFEYIGSKYIDNNKLETIIKTI